MDDIKKSVITVIGGGNSSYALIAFLSLSGHKVNLLTRKPEKWSRKINLEYQTPEGQLIQDFKGTIDNISSDPSKLIPASDIIILSMPVASYRNALHNIAKHISNEKKTYIMTVYGQAGFNWMTDEIKQLYNLNNIVTCAIGLIPWICRTKEYGKTGITFGPKAVNVIAIDKKDEFDYLNSLILEDICFKWFKTGHFVQAENFISLSLSVDNQIIHTSRLYGLYLKHGGIWKTKKEVPAFYKDYDELSATLLKELDSDYSLIRDEIIKQFKNNDFKYMLDYLALERFSYNSANENILDSFKNSVTLRAIGTPTVTDENRMEIFDKNHRFFNDDIFYGLCIAKWFAEQMNLKVNTIDKILIWAQDLLKIQILNNDNTLNIQSLTLDKFKTGIPVTYNLSSLEECVS